MSRLCLNVYSYVMHNAVLNFHIKWSSTPKSQSLLPWCDMTGVWQVWLLTTNTPVGCNQYYRPGTSNTRILENRLPMPRFRHVHSLIHIDYRLKMAQRTAVTWRWLTRRTHIANLLRVASNSPLGYSNDTLASIAPYPNILSSHGAIQWCRA